MNPINKIIWQPEENIDIENNKILHPEDNPDDTVVMQCAGGGGFTGCFIISCRYR